MSIMNYTYIMKIKLVYIINYVKGLDHHGFSTDDMSSASLSIGENFCGTTVSSFSACHFIWFFLPQWALLWEHVTSVCNALEKYENPQSIRGVFNSATSAAGGTWAAAVTSMGCSDGGTWTTAVTLVEAGSNNASPSCSVTAQAGALEQVPRLHAVPAIVLFVWENPFV